MIKLLRCTLSVGCLTPLLMQMIAPALANPVPNNGFIRGADGVLMPIQTDVATPISDPNSGVVISPDGVHTPIETLPPPIVLDPGTVVSLPEVDFIVVGDAAIAPIVLDAAIAPGTPPAATFIDPFSTPAFAPISVNPLVKTNEVTDAKPSDYEAVGMPSRVWPGMGLRWVPAEGN